MGKADEILIAEYEAGNMSALEEIFQRYKTRILNYALRLLSNLADAEDVVGEVFFVLTSRKYDYKPRAQVRFSTWLYTVAHNLCMDKARRRKKTLFLWFGKEDQTEELSLADPNPPASETAQKSDTEEIIREAVENLPLKYREAIVLREYQNLTYEEIAAVLGVTLSQVKVDIFRARERLRKKLLPLFGEGR